MVNLRWTWPREDAEGVARLWNELRERGVSFFHMPDACDAAWTGQAFIERVLGQRPLRAIATLIKPQPDEKKTTPLERHAYPMNAGPASLHVDSPSGGPVPPQLQLMVCMRAAAEGGESTILDVWRLLEKVEALDPALYRDLFEVSRTVLISGKPHRGPLLALRNDQLVLYHGRSVDPLLDPIAERFRRWVEAEPLIEFRPEPGDVYVNNNHRTLHGRRDFTDTSREFLRYLVWPSVPLQAPSRLLDRALVVAPGIDGPRGGPTRRLNSVRLFR